MNEFIEILKKWSSEDQTISLARVIKTWGSSPRPVGSAMMIDANGNVLGSVSGGCVEGAVTKQALAIKQEGEAAKVTYGVSDEDAWSVGLSCGGSIQVFIQSIKFDNKGIWQQLLDNIDSNEPSIVVSTLEDGKNRNSLLQSKKDLIGDALPQEVIDTAWQTYNERSNRVFNHEEVDYFIHVFPRKPLLLVIGAAHITVDLVGLANNFGFETVVIDPRGYFAENTVFPDQPDQLLQSYPSEVLHNFPLDAYTFCAILSHDPKIDDNALEVLLPSEVGYIGALGSRKTHAKRTKRLLDNGVSQELIDRIKAPIGMPIHAKSAREIALAVMGEIIAAKNEFL